MFIAPKVTGSVLWICSSPRKIRSIRLAVVPTFARVSTKLIASKSGPAIPADRIIDMIKVAAGKLPLTYRSQPKGSTVIKVVGAITFERETGS